MNEGAGMRGRQEPGANLEPAAQKRRVDGLRSAGSDLDRKYWVALALYVVLAALAWFTLGEGKVFVGAKPVELRMFPLVILGAFALRTVLARHAEKIRRSGSGGGSTEPKS
jgi:hypothetical protein